MLTLAQTTVYQEEIKKSRFIVTALPLSDLTAINSLLQEVRQSKANHNCWAYKFAEVLKYSDDGEPSGTAGKPIMQALEYSGLDRLLVVVTRYFGGIKLGAGGLIRAYSSVTSNCLKQAAICEKKYLQVAECFLSFSFISDFYNFVSHYQLQIKKEEYQANGLHFTLAGEPQQLAAFSQKMTTVTHGQIEFFLNKNLTLLI